MKKQLLLFTALCGLTYGTAVAQNADMDKQADNYPSVAAYKQVTDSPPTTFKETENHYTLACTADSMCPQSSTYSGNVRGYYFIAPVSFNICGLFIPTDASTANQSIEVLRFKDSLPPAYPGFTNNFVSLFYTANNASTSMIPCNIAVNAGDSIGVYGARGTGSDCSYTAGQCSTTIFGNPVILYRSGMQFPLYNQQMHDVWSEIANSISRVIMYIDAPTSVPETIMDPSLVSVYPNPSNGIFNLKMQQFENLKMKDIEIYNMYGEKVAANFQINSSSNFQIDLSEAPSGIYFLYAQTEQGRVVKKIVISK